MKSGLVIDAHVHLFTGKNREKLNDSLLDRAERAGIDRIAVSSLGRTRYMPSPIGSEVSELNDDTARLMKKHRGKVFGFCYLNPLNKNCLDELEKRADEGFLGIKLWIAAKCSSPSVFFVVEKGIKKGMIILIHSYMRTSGNLENESSPFDVALLAGKYPEAKIIMAHASANGGAGMEAVRKHTNVYVDTSGGWPEKGFVEKAAAIIGPRRVLFGSDAPGRSFSVQLSKIKSAGVSEAAKKLILGGNFLRIAGIGNN